jgi:catechol 2,3-dioxygenase-like lactoylglutathione lyase family enzyme
MKLRPMLQVRDVASSSAWYQNVLGLQSGHGGDEYEMLFAGADFVLQLHHDDPAEHRIPKVSGEGGDSSGVTLWFEAEDRSGFEELVERARSAEAHFMGDPEWNPVAHHHEATILDPDGYIVVLHSPFEAP